MANMMIQPKVGMCATYSIGSDRYPYVVVKVKSPKNIIAVRLEDDNERVKDEQGLEFIADKARAITEWNAMVQRQAQQYLECTNLSIDERESMAKEAVKYFEDKHTWSLRKDHHWAPKGAKRSGAGHLHLGFAYSFLDPHF